MINFFTPQQFGAKANGIADDTISVQAALNACKENGGAVLLENGTFLCTSLQIFSNTTLEIAPTATLLASSETHLYKTDTHHNRYRNEPELDRCFIFAQNATNIKLCGTGHINGNAPAIGKASPDNRPMLIRILECSHVYINQLHLHQAAAWTCAFLDSTFIYVSEIHIFNNATYNGDGLDFDGCHHVYVSNCHCEGTDDNLCLQSSNRNCYDIHITNCSFSSTCAGIRIGLKSIFNIYNVVISNCTMHNVHREGIKIECTEGGTISDILVNNIAMRNTRRPIFVLLNNRFEENDLGSSVELTAMPQIGSLERLQFSNISIVDDETMEQTHYRFNNDIMGSPKFCGMRFDAQTNHPINDVVLQNINYTAYGNVAAETLPKEYPKVLDKIVNKTEPSSSNYWPDWSRSLFLDCRNINTLTLQGIIFTALHEDTRPAYIFENCNITSDNYSKHIICRKIT